MLRNTFLALLAVLAVASVSQAATTLGAAGDAKTSVAYDSVTGNLTLQPDGTPVGLFQILSASGIFSGAATLPPGGLGFDVNTANEKSWAALPASAVSANFNLGNIAGIGRTQAFLLNDLTINYSGGFGTNNAVGDLVYVGGVALTPVITPVALGERQDVAVITTNLNASNGPITWSGLTLSAGSAVPGQAATLSGAGAFSWNPAGSKRGKKGTGQVAYSWTATATNSAGASSGVAITLTLIPEPATMSLVGLGAIGFLGLVRRRS